MTDKQPPGGIVYTETVVFAPPEQYAADAPYQLAIIDLDSGPRTTVRIITNDEDDRVRIGDKLLFVEERNGVAYYRKATAEPVNASETLRPLT
jgi:uncharacterized OB-fold protein